MTEASGGGYRESSTAAVQAVRAADKDDIRPSASKKTRVAMTAERGRPIRLCVFLEYPIDFFFYLRFFVLLGT